MELVGARCSSARSTTDCDTVLPMLDRRSDDADSAQMVRGKIGDSDAYEGTVDWELLDELTARNILRRAFEIQLEGT